MTAARAGEARRAWSGLQSARLARYFWGYVFVSPWIAGFLIFTAYPMVYSAVIAFAQFDLLSPPRFIGAENFGRMVRDELFYVALGNTAYYTFIAVPLQVLLALGMALMLNQKLQGINVFRTLFYLPTVTPAVASVILFVYMFNYDFGFFNWMLSWIGIPKINWLGDTLWVKPAFVVMSLWRVGGQMVIFLAGLQSVPLQLVEAASIDGAGVLRRFWHVTVPMITPVIFFNLVLGIIDSFQIFTTAFIATDGGPINSTLFYVLWLYRHAFENFKMGYAATLAWILLGVILIFTLIQFYLARKWVYYESAVR